MLKILLLFVGLMSVVLFANEHEQQQGVSSGFRCPLSGCTLECTIDNNKPIKITKIRSISMLAYPKIGTFYELDMGMKEKRTIMINGDAVLCQIINHK